MSVLALYLEQSGIATTIISLIRLHSEKVSPPRSLWVPFELGRPLGDPGDHPQHEAVLRKTLSLFEQVSPPGAIVDYKSEPVSGATWSPPTVNATNFADEIAALKPVHERAVHALGRTTVGISGLPIEEVRELIESMATTGESTIHRPQMNPTLLLRYAVDDLKAFVLETGAGGQGGVASIALGEWFWRDTHSGQMLLALRDRLQGSERTGLKTLGQNFVVPRLWVERLNLG